MADHGEYKKSSLNTVIRYRSRGKYDFETIHHIIDEATLLHVSFVDPDQEYPVILPMLGFMGSYSEEATGPKSLYLHGYISSRLFRKSRDDDANLKVTVSATLLDGLVLALTPNHHSCNYRSAVVFGRAYLVTDEKERYYAMENIMNKTVPGRWEGTRIPPTDAELKATGIIRVDIDSGSAKIRTGTTGEDRNDLKDKSMRERVWAGVIPTYVKMGTPTPAPTNMTNKTPEYITGFVTEMNEKSEHYAYQVAL